MPTVPRNAPCPCGSGRKHKLCCGTTRDQERAQRTAFEDLFALPASFPLLRPDSDDFEDWLSAHRDEPPIRTLLEEGIETLGEGECERIARSYSRWYPKRWATLVVAVQDEAAAETIVVVGAIAVAFAEERLPDELVLEFLEDDPRLVAPADALSLCLEATDFWSVVEAVAADVVVAAIPDELDDDEYTRQRQAALTREATRLLTTRHRRRLSLLVGRLARELPIEGSRVRPIRSPLRAQRSSATAGCAPASPRCSLATRSDNSRRTNFDSPRKANAQGSNVMFSFASAPFSSASCSSLRE